MVIIHRDDEGVHTHATVAERNECPLVRPQHLHAVLASGRIPTPVAGCKACDRG